MQKYNYLRDDLFTKKVNNNDDKNEQLKFNNCTDNSKHALN